MCELIYVLCYCLCFLILGYCSGSGTVVDFVFDRVTVLVLWLISFLIDAAAYVWLLF